jgi:SepF-like predicted cell division protein (DUF552 family)
MFKVFEAKKKEEERVEIEVPEKKVEPRLWVKVENLTGLADTDRIVRRVKEGNILFLRMAELQKKNLGQFKATMAKLKRECIRFGWDIVALADGYLIITPEKARIVR